MTTSTSPVLLTGVEPYGAGFRVRVRFPNHLVPSGRLIEAGFRTPEEANARALELRRLRAGGISPLVVAAQGRTLGEAAAALLQQKKVSGRSRKLRGRGVEHWARSLRPWIEGEHAATPLTLLRRETIKATILGRALEAPTAARNELQALKAVIRSEPNAQIDPSILTIEPIAVEPRQRRALSLDELDLLSECAPRYARRLILILGTAGLRVGEAFTLSDDRVALWPATDTAPAHGSALVTAELAKERLPKQVALDSEQVGHLRHQLLERAPGTRLVFPTATGKQWRYGKFHKLVWSKACSRAAVIWRDDRGLDQDAPTPFCDLTPHDLRSTAATLMRAVGFTREEAADRLGHVDSGELLDRIYDQGDRGARAQRAIAARAPLGLRHALEDAEQAARPSTRPAVAAVLGAPEGIA